MSGNSVIKVRGLHVHYGASHALQGVNIEVTEGVHAVLGRNGMGKTTLCNAIMGLVPVSSGSVRFEGQELVGKSPHQIARMGVGYTPQRRRLWPSLTVDEHLRLCAQRGSPWTPERIYDSFPRLAERRNNGGAQLSGGEQQMLAISRALLPNPRLLVMDEPTEGLAPVIVDQVVDMLGKIAGEGDVAIFLVEQNIAVATAVSQDCAIMVNGRISTVIDAAKLSSDRALQQRLLGVGRLDDTEMDATPQPTDPGSETPIADAPTATATPTVKAPQGAWRYVPPKRWSPSHWDASTTSDPGVTPSSAAAVLPAGNVDGSVLVVGTFDTKATELNFIRDRLVLQGLRVKTIDLSTSGKPSSADVPPHHIAVWHPSGASGVFTGDRGTAVAGMALAFERWSSGVKGVAGIISAAGSGGTALATPAMRAMPVGVPKVMISTVASGEVGQYVGPSDIMMMYSVTDVQGINQISAKVLANGADALAGAVKFARENAPAVPQTKPAIGLTMFGVTTPAVQQVTALMEADYECLVFHATGVGGRSMEKLADNGYLQGVLDLTTTEICDMMLGGVFPANEDRFGAFIRNPIPYVGSVGALDMCNWGAPPTIPEKYQHRQFYEHNPQVTLMRTTAEENTRFGHWIAERLNQMPGPVRFLLPLKGVSALDAEGQPFDNPLARQSLYDALRSTFRATDTHKLIDLDCHINDPAFADAALAAFHDIAGQPQGARHA
ncbi:MAG: ABC transporter permease [Pseudomonadota bacterium]